MSQLFLHAFCSAQSADWKREQYQQLRIVELVPWLFLFSHARPYACFQEKLSEGLKIEVTKLIVQDNQVNLQRHGQFTQTGKEK